ncbi:LamG-like jellyroll fold domain-containing protein [Streptomyces sp. NPDC006700]|uniref:LamG-like jellyroll fold domain-containing protein n=1 Tax=unclassified Streptomyces TaxID=2593676 RepID=UPI0033FBB1EB
MPESDALAEARRTGKPVEVSARRGKSREVFATPEGHLEAREYLRPVWARGRGGWKRVDTGLVGTVGGMVAPRVATVDVEFSGGGGSAPLVRMRRAGRELSLTWPTALPKPRLEGAVATYPSVLPDVDLRMTAQEDGFTQLLVVKSAKAAASKELAELRLRISASGLDVRKTGEGGLEAVDKGASGAVFEAPKPMMWDSGPREQEAVPAQARAATLGAQATAPEGASGEPGAGEPGKLAPVGVEVTARQDELVLTPDADMLKGAGTTYPVYIDPQWSTPRASAWTMVSKYWASTPQWKFNGASEAGLGYCDWDYCTPNDTKRLFYRIPTSEFAGKSILSAEFVVRNTRSASCDARSVELWRTEDISSSTTWNSQNASGFWVEQLASKPFAYGNTGCAAKDAEFDVQSAVQSAADSESATMTFGLRAASETDGYGWKRFSDTAYLRVRYNQPPPQVNMSQLTMEYGGTCEGPADAPHVRSLGTVYANNITDPDGDNVAVQFEAEWDTGDGQGLIARWDSGLTTYKSSGSSFSIRLPSSVPQNKQVSWHVRSYDGVQYSPWSYEGDSTSCYFTYDPGVSEAPSTPSDQYPDPDPEKPDHPGDDQQRPQVKARWMFEETTGAGPVTTPNAVSGGSALTLHGGARKSDSAFIDFGSLELDGVGGYAATTSVPVDTSGSYTVTAWAQAAAAPTSSVAVVSAEGSPQSAFTVRFVPDTANGEGFGHWELAVPDKDDTGATVVRVKNSEFYDVRDWNHLAVVYDGFARQARLYVNGTLQEVSCDDAEDCVGRRSWAENTLAFKATESFQVGRAKTDGAWGEYFPGLIDDVWAFQGALSDEQVQKLAVSWFGLPTEVPGLG